jgi:hypothetical protein
MTQCFAPAECLLPLQITSTVPVRTKFCTYSACTMFAAMALAC